MKYETFLNGTCLFVKAHLLWWSLIFSSIWKSLVIPDVDLFLNIIKYLELYFLPLILSLCISIFTRCEYLDWFTNCIDSFQIVQIYVLELKLKLFSNIPNRPKLTNIYCLNIAHTSILIYDTKMQEILLGLSEIIL